MNYTFIDIVREPRVQLLLTLTNANSAENISVNYTFCVKSRKMYKQNIFKNILCFYDGYHKKLILSEFF